ncbi:MAG: hypothetical protein WAM39_05705, partial [Bryobacteraceae bacterium]
SKGLMLKGAYTYSHAIDYTDDDGWADVNYNQPSEFQRNRQTAGFNQGQVFQLGWVYELPFGKDKPWLNTGLVSKVLGGWQFSGIESAYTGTPLLVTASGASLNAPDNLQTPNQVMPSVPFIGAVGPGTTYYNPAAFAAVNTQTYGNVGPNILNNPGVWNTDMSIVRNFPIMEKATLQFRTEFYNLPNTSHFSAVGDTNVGDAAFMQVTSSYGERNIRFALRLQW